METYRGNVQVLIFYWLPSLLVKTIYGATFEDNMTSQSQDIMEKQIQR